MLIPEDRGAPATRLVVGELAFTFDWKEVTWIKPLNRKQDVDAATQ
jgi:hypothetical protein